MSLNKIAMYEDNRARETSLIKTVLIKMCFYSLADEKSGKCPDTMSSCNAYSFLFCSTIFLVLYFSFLSLVPVLPARSKSQPDLFDSNISFNTNLTETCLGNVHVY